MNLEKHKLFKKINHFAGFNDLPGLSAKHHVTLSIVRRYLDFKVKILFVKRRKVVNIKIETIRIIR